MSIQDRITQIRENSVQWRNRVQSSNLEERIPKVDAIRRSLIDSQEGWRKRVEDKDVSNFTVEGRLRNLRKPTIQRSLTLNLKCTPTNGSPEPQPTSTLLEQALRCPQRLPAIPILRVTSKENRPVPKKFHVDPCPTESTVGPLNETTKQVVSVPKLQDDALTGFFTSDLIETDEYKHIQLPDEPQRRGRELDSTYKKIAEARRAVRPERRKPSKGPNPLTSLAQRTDLRSEYEEVRSNSANLRTPTPNRPLMRTIDPACRLSFEAAQRRSMLADSVVAGLSSTENFSDAKSSLRQVNETQPPPLTEAQRQLLPYKSIMLLQVKGRRQVQVRLVAPSADSMNSGDCYVLVTPTAVFAWFGALANVVEINKTRELAHWIHKHHELNYRGNGSESSYTSVYEQLHDDEDLTTMEIVEAGLAKTRHERKDPEAIKFWEALGYDSPRSIHAHGLPEEDELYESLIQHTNRVYEVTADQLVPCIAYWGTTLRRNLLRSDKAFVFDFGSEVYLWTGTQVSPEVRLAGIELVQQAYSTPYDYSKCRLNPLNPMSTHTNIPGSGTSRPDWTLVGKVTGKGETVLFKEKFVDWSDISRLKLQPLSSLRLNRDKSSDSNTAYTVIQPCSADQLFESAFVDAPPPPRLLTLEGRFIGRGGEGCRYEDGIMRRFSVQSGPLRIWHISEFNRVELPEFSHGQFHQGDTYVIRWPFKVIYVGLRDIPSRANDASREQCVYFFWHGSQSKITEKGASALMTIELDEERCPQIRVTEGKEPPAFCRLFDGRMVIHFGRRLASTPSSPTTNSTSSRVRLFLVRGEAPAEGYLLEVPAQLSSLRSQGVFLALQYTNGNPSSDNNGSTDHVLQKAWMWYGMYASKVSISVAVHILDRLKQSCPIELASELRHVIEFTQTEDKLGPGELVFLLNAEDRVAAPLCLQSNPSQGQLVVWHVTAQLGSTMQTRRLSYTLQPDPSMLTGLTSGKLPLSDRTQGYQGDHDQQTHQRESNPLAIAKAVAERLRASNDAANAQLKQSVAQSGFPFLLSELYAASQPALFLVLDGRQAVYLWQGWWPLRRRSRDQNGSHLLRSPTCSRSSAHSTVSSCSSVGDDSPGFFGSDYERCEIGSFSGESVETVSPGSARTRFYALRLAGLKTAKALATKLGVRASVVYAGLEPSQFLALFPPQIRSPEITANYNHEEYKSDGQMDDVNDLLATNKPGSYTLYDLQQRPLPPDLDATCLEVYLDNDSFQNAFSMSREEFEELPKWKKCELRKNLGLF